MYVENVEQVGIPCAAVLIEDTCARSHGNATLPYSAELPDEILADGYVASGLGGDVGLGMLQPDKLGGPIAGVEDATGALVDGALIKLLAEDRNSSGASCIGPSEDWGERCAGVVESDEVVPEGVDGDGADPAMLWCDLGEDVIDAVGDSFRQLGRVEGESAGGRGGGFIGYTGLDVAQLSALTIEQECTSR